MMAHEQLKPKDKVVMRMTGKGAVEENLTKGTSEKISKRPEDTQLVKPYEDAALVPPSEDEAKRRYQPQPQEPSQLEAPDVDELPVHDSPSHISLVSDVHHAAPVDVGRVISDTAVSSGLRRTDAVRNVDTDAVLSRAAETAADQPASDDAPTTGIIRRLERKSRKAHERLDAARENLPTRKVLKKERVFDEETGKGKTRLIFEDELKKPKGQSKLRFETDKTVRKVGDTLASGIHGKIHEVEQDNSAVEAAHRSEILAESAARHYSHHRQSQANKPFEKVSKLEHEAQVADTKLHYEKTKQEHPEMKKNRKDMNKHYQKSAIKKEYAAARLTENVVVETRYRTETRVSTRTVTDPETGETSIETYTYEVQVPYDYYICYVTLENFNLSHVPVYIMSGDQLSMYATYMSVVGNREDLFPSSEYVDKYIENPPDEYTVNTAYMPDPTFAALIAEAEKYLNYPYVWGGSNPDTSFDCSGFVSYALTNSGLVNTGRLGAQGLYNV